MRITSSVREKKDMYVCNNNEFSGIVGFCGRRSGRLIHFTKTKGRLVVDPTVWVDNTSEPLIGLVADAKHPMIRLWGRKDENKQPVR